MTAVDRLREVMRKCTIAPLGGLLASSSIGMQAFVIPTEDAHQSEYVSDHDKRREWISDFTGSAGTALITENKALLWTDGRYFLQATEQLSPQWTLMRSYEANVPTIEEWLAKNLKPGDQIGVDPFLTSVTFFKKLQDALEPKGVAVVQAQAPKNLVDQVWANQPPQSKEVIKVLPVKYAGKSIQEKLDQIREKMTDLHADAMVLTALDDIAWMFNIRGSDIEFNPVCIAYAFITLDQAILFVDPEKVDAQAREHFGGKVEFQPYDKVLEFISTYTASHAASKVLVDSNQCNLAVYKAIPSANRMKHQSLVLAAKAIKNEVEQEGLRQSHIRDGLALVKFFAWLKDQLQAPTMELTEVAIADVQQKFRERVEGYQSLSFDTISSIGPNGAIIHYKPEKETCKTLNTNELYLNDSGGQYLDGTTDVTRTMHFGTPTAYEKECYTRVLKGHIALATMVFPEGIDGIKLDTVARLALWQGGLDYLHGTGHGIGAYLNVHEKGVLMASRANPHGLKIGKGMAVTNEPGYYEAGKFGIRIENVMLCHDHPVASSGKFCSFETITMAPIQQNLIDVNLLTIAEIQWLNDYHFDVRTKLLQELEKEAQNHDGQEDIVDTEKIREYILQETTPIEL